MLSTSKFRPTKCWKDFPRPNGHFEVGVRVTKETTIGCFVLQKWERKCP